MKKTLLTFGIAGLVCGLPFAAPLLAPEEGSDPGEGNAPERYEIYLWNEVYNEVPSPFTTEMSVSDEGVWTIADFLGTGVALSFQLYGGPYDYYSGVDEETNEPYEGAYLDVTNVTGLNQLTAEGWGDYYYIGSTTELTLPTIDGGEVTISPLVYKDGINVETTFNEDYYAYIPIYGYDTEGNWVHYTAEVDWYGNIVTVQPEGAKFAAAQVVEDAPEFQTVYGSFDILTNDSTAAVSYSIGKFLNTSKALEFVLGEPVEKDGAWTLPLDSITGATKTVDEEGNVTFALPTGKNGYTGKFFTLKGEQVTLSTVKISGNNSTFTYDAENTTVSASLQFGAKNGNTYTLSWDWTEEIALPAPVDPNAISLYLYDWNDAEEDYADYVGEGTGSFAGVEGEEYTYALDNFLGTGEQLKFTVSGLDAEDGFYNLVFAGETNGGVLVNGKADYTVEGEEGPVTLDIYYPYVYGDWYSYVYAGEETWEWYLTVYTDDENCRLVYFETEPYELPEITTSGVAAVEGEEGEAEYYTLQGVRVQNPGNGIYIVRKGNKAHKVMIRK